MKRLKDAWIVGAGVFIVALLSLCNISCRDPYKPMWVAGNTVAKARNLTDTAIDNAFKAKKKKCLEEYGKHKDPKTYASCVEESREGKAIVAWQVVWPVITGSLRLLETSLIMAEKIKDDSAEAKKQWITHLKTAVCATAMIVGEFGDLFPEDAKQIKSYLDLVKMVTCDK